MQRLLIIMIVMLVASTSCGGSDGDTGSEDAAETPSTSDPTVTGVVAPATYRGARMCADCPGVEITLTLRADGIYFLRHVIGNPATDGEREYGLGRWMLTADGFRLILERPEGGPMQMAIVPDGRLRILDADGNPADIDDIDALATGGRPDNFAEPMPLEGVYRYMADAGLMMPCGVSRWFPVMQEDDLASLERAYLRAQSAPGAPVMVAVEGHLAERPWMEGEEDVMVVTRFDRIVGGEPCEQPADSPLENTYWRLVEVDHRQVVTPADAREPHLKLRDGAVQGFGGCNGMNTTYERKGNRLEFAPFATTMMYCEGGSEIETAFHRALAEHTRFRISGETLELFKDDALLARFEAMYFE